MATRTRSVVTPLTLAEYQALVAGIPKNCPNATFTVAGQTFTSTQAVTFIQGALSAVSATATAKTGWKDAILAEQKVILQDGPTVKAIRDVIETMFSNSTTTLAEFLITPKKPYTPLSTEARAAANAKAKATRAARGTTGKAAKAAITGNVTGVTITPITSGASAPSASAPAVASSPSASPAPVASPPAQPAASPAPVAAPSPAVSSPTPSPTAATAPIAAGVGSPHS